MDSIWEEYDQRRLFTVNMAFHSTSFLPGCSPFVSEESDLKRFLKRIEDFFGFGANWEVSFMPLQEAKKIAQSQDRVAQ